MTASPEILGRGAGQGARGGASGTPTGTIVVPPTSTLAESLAIDAEELVQLPEARLCSLEAQVGPVTSTPGNWAPANAVVPYTVVTPDEPHAPLPQSVAGRPLFTSPRVMPTDLHHHIILGDALAQFILSNNLPPPPEPPDHLPLAVCSCLCCWCLSLAAIWESRHVHMLYARGDYQGSYEASARARSFAIMAIAVGTLLLLLGLFSSKR